MLVSNFLRVMSNVLLSYKYVSSKQISLSVLSPVMCTTLKRRQLFMYEDDDRRPHEPNLSRLMKITCLLKTYTRTPQRVRYQIPTKLPFHPCQQLRFFIFLPHPKLAFLVSRDRRRSVYFSPNPEVSADLPASLRLHRSLGDLWGAAAAWCWCGTRAGATHGSSTVAWCILWVNKKTGGMVICDPRILGWRWLFFNFTHLVYNSQFVEGKSRNCHARNFAMSFIWGQDMMRWIWTLLH